MSDVLSDPFRHHSLGPTGPAIGALAVTPSDSSDLARAVRAITIGGSGGTISFVSSRDGASCVTGPLPPGTYALCARRICATGTTATLLTGWV